MSFYFDTVLQKQSSFQYHVFFNIVAAQECALNAPDTKIYLVIMVEIWVSLGFDFEYLQFKSGVDKIIQYAPGSSSIITANVLR